MRVNKYKLGELVKIDSGYAFKSEFFNEAEGMPIIRIRDVSAGYSNTRYKGEYDNRYIVNNGDYLITMDGNFKISEWKGGVALLNQRVCRISVVSDKLERKYLYYFLPAELKSIEVRTPFVTVKHLSVSDINDIIIPLPSIEIQRRIAVILDKAQELIDKRKEQIKKLDELVQSVFLDMFGDPGMLDCLHEQSTFLSSICLINPPKSELVNIDDDTTVTFLPMANVDEDGNINLSEVRTLAEVKNSFTYFRNGDVLFAKITPCMENGKGAIVNGLRNGIGFGSTEFHVLRPLKNISSEWLYYLTKMKSFRKQAEKSMTGSAGQKRVPKQFLESYKVVIPPHELQCKFSAFVKKTKQQKSLMQQSLTEMENNFNSLMQRAFRGELF